MRKLSSISTILVLSALLFGCGSAEPVNTDTVQTADADSAAVTSEDTAQTAETAKDAEPAGTVVIPDAPFPSEVFVEQVPDLPRDFICGMDISSLLSEEESGVVYFDKEGREAPLCRILADAGVDTIRVRVWNDPCDAEGHGYGGGNCDATRAGEIGRAAAKQGQGLLVDFHYSDFWADPKKQMAPKAWAGMSIEEKAQAAYDYTAQSLNTILDAGADVRMVQIGNEINYGLAGETQEGKIIQILKQASAAVRDTAAARGCEIRIAVHFTEADDPGFIARKAAWLTKEDLDYDVFGLSYYPYWHGSLENLTEVLTATRETTGKDVMILETAFPYTTEDGDGTGNSAGDRDELGVYHVSVAGQAQAVHDVAAAAVKGGATGLFYWEGAWIPVPGNTKEEREKLWEQYGSGWASSYAGSYDPDDAGKYYGGSSWDNQAFFDHTGHVLPSLDVFAGIRTGTVSDADPMSGYCKDPNETAPSEAASLLKNPGFEEEDISMWEVTCEGSDPTDRQTKEADAKSGKNAFHFWSANAVEFTMQQTVTVEEDGEYDASAFLQGGDTGKDADIRFFVLVNGEEAGSEPVTLDGWVNWKEPAVHFTAAAGDAVSVGVSVKCAPGGWGTVDDVVLAPAEAS